MKNVFSIILTALLFSCGTQKIVSYNYLASTRGYTLTIDVNKETVKIVTDNRRNENGPETKSSVTDPELWNALQKGSKTIKLNEIEKLESPTNRRQFDGAMFAKLTLTTQDSTYRSAGFDHGKPPIMLKTVADSMVTIGLGK